MPQGHEVRTFLEGLKAATASEINSLRQTAANLGEVSARIAQQADAARFELAAVYVAHLNAEWLKSAEERTGFRGFSRFDPLAAQKREIAKLNGEIAAVRADESYVRREYLVGPNGSVTRRLAEARDLLAPWEAECKRFEDLNSFLELYEAKYDTPEFDRRWWQPSYWRLWAAGDKICDALQLADFGDDVLPAYEKVRKPREDWRGVVAGIEGERDAVLGLVQRHDQAVYRLANIDAIYLEECRKALATHLETADPALLQQWAGEDRGAVMGLRKVAGLAAKQRFLADLQTGLGNAAQQLDARLPQYNLKIQKLHRPKKAYAYYPESAMPQKAYDGLAKLADSRAKIMGIARRIESYDDYEKFDLSVNAPELWWVEMTGRPPSRWTPGTMDWYDRHPGYSVTHDSWGHHHGHSTGTMLGAAAIGAVAGAAIDHALHDHGDIS